MTEPVRMASAVPSGREGYVSLAVFVQPHWQSFLLEPAEALRLAEALVESTALITQRENVTESEGVR